MAAIVPTITATTPDDTCATSTEWFAEGFNTTDLKDAKASLYELTG